MKKFFLPLLLLILAAPVVIVSCSKTDDPPANTTTSTSSTSTTSSTNSTSSTMGPDSNSFTVDGTTRYIILNPECQQTGGSAETYFMSGFASNGDKINTVFHKEPTVAKDFTITTNGAVTADTSQVQIKVIIAGVEYVATGGTMHFGYDGIWKRITFSGITFRKVNTTKVISAHYNCQL